MRTRLLFWVFFLYGFSFYGQDVATDSKNKGVFTYYNFKKYRVDFSSKEFSLTLSTKPYYTKYVDSSSGTVNAVKTSNYYIQPSIINASDFFNVSKLSEYNLGGRLKIGYQRTVDNIRKDYPGFVVGFGGSLFYAIDNFTLYNTLVNKIEQRNPVSYGIDLNGTLFFPKKNWVILTGNITFSNGWNDFGLLNFKDISNVIVNGDIVAFDNFDGKYGELVTNIQKLRFAASAPVTFSYLNFTPYIVVNALENVKPIILTGIFTNILSKKIDFQNFKLPSTFGFGIDWIRKESEWSKANIFIRGSVNIFEYTKDDDPKIKEKESNK